MKNREYECRRCTTRFQSPSACLMEGAESWGDTEIRCPKCGSAAVEACDGVLDTLEVLRTRGAGKGCC